ncbi:hypothetical protein FS749_004737, partial [Ceratobasidium sp. UAMH 11750]
SSRAPHPRRRHSPATVHLDFPTLPPAGITGEETARPRRSRAACVLTSTNIQPPSHPRRRRLETTTAATRQPTQPPADPDGCLDTDRPALPFPLYRPLPPSPALMLSRRPSLIDPRQTTLPAEADRDPPLPLTSTSTSTPTEPAGCADPRRALHSTPPSLGKTTRSTPTAPTAPMPHTRPPPPFSPVPTLSPALARSRPLPLPPSLPLALPLSPALLLSVPLCRSPVPSINDTVDLDPPLPLCCQRRPRPLPRYRQNEPAPPTRPVSHPRRDK